MRISVFGHDELGEALSLAGFDDVLMLPTGTKGNVAVAESVRGVPAQVKDNVVFVLCDSDPEAAALAARLGSTELCSLLLTESLERYQATASLRMLPLGSVTVDEVGAALSEFVGVAQPQFPAGIGEARVEAEGLVNPSPAPVQDQPAPQQPAAAPAWAEQPPAAAPAPVQDQPAPQQPAAPPAPVQDQPAPAPAWAEQPQPQQPAAELVDDRYEDLPTFEPEPSFAGDLPGWLAGSSGNGHAAPVATPQVAHGRGTSDCTVLVFGSLKGGSGKSTTALLAAATLAEETGKKVALVDANFAQSSQSTLLSLRGSAPTIFDVSRPPFDANKLKNTIVNVPGTSLDVLLSPPKARKADPKVLNPELWVRCVTEMREWYDYVVVDTEVAKVLGEPMFDRFIFQVVDQLVVVVAPGEAVGNNVEWLESVTDPHVAGGMNFDMDRIHVLLNMARDGVGWDEPDVQAMFTRFGWLGSIPFADEVQKAANDTSLHLAQSEARNAMMASLYRLTREPALNRPGKPSTVADPVRSRGGLLAKLWRS